MSRKKQFGIDEVMHKAMVAFWDQGYRATSLQDLVECMGINRASLYDTFGDKYTLFIDSLYSYRSLYLNPYLAEIMKTYSPRQAIIGLFEETTNRILQGEPRNGCFIINSAMELSSHDDKVAKFVSQCFTQIEKQFFLKMIKRGKASGEIAESVVPISTARTLLSLFIGLRVLSRSNPQKALFQSIIEQVQALVPHGEHVLLSHTTSRSHKSRRNQIRSHAAHAA